MYNFLKKLNKSRGGQVKRQIFAHCLKVPTFSIPDIARNLNLSIPTMSKYIDEMCKDGYLQDCGKAEISEGRHPNLYGLNPDSGYFIGVDIRWDSLGFGIINFAGKVLKIVKDEKFVLENTPEKVDEIAEKIELFIKDIGNDKKTPINKNEIINININLTGRVNPQVGFTHNILNFEEVSLASIFEDKLGIHVTIDNDARSISYGEYVLSYANKYKDFIFINLDRGLGMGLIINGKIYEGKSGYSGELGHINVYDNEILCHCGKKGCLETEVSGLALCREVQRRIDEGSKSILSVISNSEKKINIDDIIDAINNEDILCIEEIEKIASKLGQQIANLLNIFNPEIVVIGGKLSLAGDYLLQPLKLSVRKYSLNLLYNDTKIVLSKLYDKAGIVGSCYISRYRIFEKY